MIHSSCCCYWKGVNEVGDSIVRGIRDYIRIVCMLFFYPNGGIFHHPASHVMGNLILPPFDFSPSVSQVMTDYSFEMDVS